MPATASAWSSRKAWLLFAILLFAYGWLFNWSESLNNPNEMVRVYTVRAMVEQHNYSIGTRDERGNDSGPIYSQWGYVNDKALVCNNPAEKPPHCAGKLYAAKAPGMMFLGFFPHALLRGIWQRAGWGQPSKAAVVWWLRFSCVIIPSIFAWLWLRRHLASRLVTPGLAIIAVLAAALGSLSLTYGQMFAGHQVCGLALLLAFGAAVSAGDRSNGGPVALAGFAAASAIAIEFTAAPPAILLVLWLLTRRRQIRDIAWISLGALLPTLLLAHGNWRAFGAPWHLSYAHLENPEFVRDMAPGIFGFHLPTADKVTGSLISPFTGLFFWAPWMLFLALFPLVFRRPPTAKPSASWLMDRRGEAGIALFICLYFLAFQCSHSLWRGGWVVGPRYITAMVPFAAIVCAHALDALPALPQRVIVPIFAAFALTAICVTGLASAVSQGFPLEVYNPLPEVVGPLLSHGWVSNNLAMHWKIAGLYSGVPYLAALLGGGIWLSLSASVGQSLRGKIGTTAVIISIFAASTTALWRIDGGRTQDDRDGTVRFLMRMWTPPEPSGARKLAEILKK